MLNTRRGIAVTQDVRRGAYRGRWTGPLLVSYAQNGEDVRLWRVFAALSRGFYVDVGAGEPVTNSVTKLFYDAVGMASTSSQARTSICSRGRGLGM